MNTQDSYIARQPILDLQGDTLGYELLFRSHADQSQARFIDEAEAGSAVLANMLSNFGSEWLLGGKTAFINVGDMTLQSDFIALLDPAKTVFEITPTTKISDVLLEKIKVLHEDGFRFAFDDCAHHIDKLALFPLISIIKIDCQRTGMLGLIAEAARAKKFCAGRKIIIIAMKVETSEEHIGAKEAGCGAFQGFYFEKPQTLKTRTLSPNAAALLQVLNLTRKEAEPREIEDALKRDVATSLKLIRYINSAGFGLRVEVTSFRHAVQILGYQKLTRWLLLLLATSNKSAPPALAKTAIARGRFMELIGKSTMGDTQSDDLFLTGTFSLLDALLGVDLPSVLPTLGLSDNVNSALLNQDGPYYPYLMLAIATERNIESMQEQWAMQMGISANQANLALFEATAWSESFTNAQ
jgi:EAL and modified HD-GYP domain-containing signal transduction protein